MMVHDHIRSLGLARDSLAHDSVGLISALTISVTSRLIFQIGGKFIVCGVAPKLNFNRGHNPDYLVQGHPPKWSERAREQNMTLTCVEP